jgi:hypothetical protein
VLEKHRRYVDKYIPPNNIFWALGLEEEFYLEAVNPQPLSVGHIKQNQKKERYSVNYRTSFKESALDEALAVYLGPDDSRVIPIPLLVNGHSLSKTNRHGEALTTYSRNPQPNPKFSGRVIHEELMEKSQWFADNYSKSYCYDGNTIELMTQNFYRATAESVCQELSEQRLRFEKEVCPLLNEMPIFKKHGGVLLQRGNHGLATYITSDDNQVNLCNNGTLHVNLTIPTYLNEEGWPSDIDDFKGKHLQAIRLIQWLEPLLVAIYGEPDFLSTYSSAFSKASQRCAISRYISLSNYNTKEAKTGKILTTDQIPDWYKCYHATSGYAQLNEIGFDIQFNKFPRHGIELRIFDRLPDSKILPLVRFLVFLLDRSLDLAKGDSNHLLVKAPQDFETWTNWVVDILRDGPQAIAEAQLIALYEELLGCKLPAKPQGMFEAAYAHLEKTYAETGYCSSRMLEKKPRGIEVVPQKKSLFCC